MSKIERYITNFLKFDAIGHLIYCYPIFWARRGPPKQSTDICICENILRTNSISNIKATPRHLSMEVDIGCK